MAKSVKPAVYGHWCLSSALFWIVLLLFISLAFKNSPLCLHGVVISQWFSECWNDCVCFFNFILYCFVDINSSHFPVQPLMTVLSSTENFLLDQYSCKMALHTSDSRFRPLLQVLQIIHWGPPTMQILWCGLCILFPQLLLPHLVWFPSGSLHTHSLILLNSMAPWFFQVALFDKISNSSWLTFFPMWPTYGPQETCINPCPSQLSQCQPSQ